MRIQPWDPMPLKKLMQLVMDIAWLTQNGFTGYTLRLKLFPREKDKPYVKPPRRNHRPDFNPSFKKGGPYASKAIPFRCLRDSCKDLAASKGMTPEQLEDYMNSGQFCRE